MLTLQNVTKHFENVRAVDNISFHVPPGCIYGLLGPNGAGKTTTIRMIMNIIRPDSGKILIRKKTVREAGNRNTGYLPEERGLYQKRKIREVVQFFGQLKGLSPKEAAGNGNYWLKRFELEDQAERKIIELSKGNQQKIQFIVAAINFPDLLILDEPFTGLDPVNQILMKDIIREFREKDKTVVLSTHQMDQVEKLCDRICLINRGQVILEGPLDFVKEKHGDQQIEIRFRRKPANIPADLFDTYTFHESTLRGHLKESVSFKDAIPLFAETGDLISIAHYTPSLEDIFIKLVGGAS